MVQKYVPVIDGRGASCKAQIDREMELGSNFLFILPLSFESETLFARVLGMAAANPTQALEGRDLLPLARYLHPKALPILKQALAEGASVHFVHQLQFPPRPDWRPNCCVVYCGVRGVISRCQNLADAQGACLEYYRELLFQGEYPEVGVYQWSEDAGPARWLLLYAPPAEACSISILPNTQQAPLPAVA